MEEQGLVQNEAGVTLIELMVVIAVAAVLLALVVPNLSDVITRNRSITQSNEVVGAVNIARSEAATRGQRVTVCALSTVGGNQCAGAGNPVSWERGWAVFVDTEGNPGSIDAGDQVLRIYPELEAGATLRTNVPALSYLATGFLESATATTFNLRVQHCTREDHRNISISATGRPTVDNVAC